MVPLACALLAEREKRYREDSAPLITSRSSSGVTLSRLTYSALSKYLSACLAVKIMREGRLAVTISYRRLSNLAV